MVRGQREKIQIGKKRDKRFEDKGGREFSISRGGDRLYSGGIHVRGVRKGSRSVTSEDAVEGAAPRVRAAKSSEFGYRKL